MMRTVSLAGSIAAALLLVGVQPALGQPQTADSDTTAEEPRQEEGDVSASDSFAVEPPELTIPVDESGWTEHEVARRVVEVSPRVRAAEASVEAAESERRARASDFAPRLDLSARYQRLSRVDLPAFEFQGTTFDNPFPQVLNQYAFRADLRVDLTRYFLTVMPQRNAAESQVDVERYRLESQRESDVLRARTVFLEYARMLAAREVAADAVELLQSQLDQVQSRRRVGQATNVDVSRVRAQLADTRIQLSRIEGEVEVARATLRRLLYLEDEESVSLAEIPDAEDEILDEDLETLRETALENRSEIMALKHTIEASQSMERAQTGGGWPQLSLHAGVDYANPNQRVFPLEQRFETTWDVGVIAQWSPNDFASRQLQADQQAARTLQAEAELEDVERDIRVQVVEAYNDLRIALESLDAAQTGVESAREAWRAQTNLRDAGEATVTDVLDVEAALRRAELNLIDARIDVRRAQADLDRAVGRGVEVAQ
jgi:outer membrane protein TolC